MSYFFEHGVSVVLVKLKIKTLAIPWLLETEVMGKVMVSLSDEAEQLVRQEVDKLYYGRSGGFSIFFEHLVRKYFDGNPPSHTRRPEKRLK